MIFLKKINWKQKLSSRKFWAAIAGFLGMIIMALGGTETVKGEVSAIIMAGGSLIVYILSEGIADSVRGLDEKDEEE